MTEATLTEWLKREGDRVERGEALFLFECDKTTLEFVAPESGFLSRILVMAGQTVPVNTAVGVIGIGIGSASENGATPHLAHTSEPAGGGDPSPHADIQAFGPARRVTMQRMTESAAQVAPVTLFTEADAVEIVRARKQIGEVAGKRLSYNAMLTTMVARALREHIYMNATFTPRGLRFNPDVNVGIAVDTDRGLLVTVIPRADLLTLEQTHLQLTDKIARTEAGTIQPDELSGATFVISNMGMFDVDAFTPIVPLPNVAILGVGRIVGRVVPFEGHPAIRDRMTLSLSFDHRAVDGAPAARFLKRIKDLIEKPYGLLVGGRQGS